MSKPIHYIVTDGEYSDYSICAAFSKKEDAEQYIKVKGGQIEEWEEGEIPDPANLYRYEVIMNMQGDIVFIGSLCPMLTDQACEYEYKPQIRNIIISNCEIRKKEFLINHTAIYVEQRWGAPEIVYKDCYDYDIPSRYNKFPGKNLKVIMWPYNLLSSHGLPEEGFEMIKATLGVKCYGKTKEEAVKITAEKWTEAKALMGNNIWREVEYSDYSICAVNV